MLRRLGLTFVLLGGVLAAGSTFLPWLGFGRYDLTLWELTTLEVVALSTSAYAAIALAALGLLRSGRELLAALAAAVVAGVAIALLDDVRRLPGFLRESGAWVAVAASAAALVGMALVVAGGDGARARRLRGALTATVFVVALVLSGEALQIHPEIEVIR